MTPEQQTRLAAMLDREEIRDLVRRERFARDQRHWQVMADCFHADAHIRTSWYDGNAVDYIPATQRMMELSPRGKHWVFPGFLHIEGDRATVESPAMIFSRITMEGIEVDLHVFCRFHSRVERRDGPWRLQSFEVLFERDILRPVNPTDQMPIDWAHLATFRPSYQFLAYLQDSRGFTVNPNLYGDDRPDQLSAFHAAETRWLHSGG